MAKGWFDYKEYEKWVKNYGIMVDDFQTWLKDFLLKMAQRVVRNAKLTHRAYKQSGMGTIDTGHMVNSWYIGKAYAIENKEVSNNELNNITIFNVDANGDDLEVEIGNNADYAEYIEYGHGTYEPRYIMTISMNTIEHQMPKRFNQAWKKFLKDRGVG